MISHFKVFWGLVSGDINFQLLFIKHTFTFDLIILFTSINFSRYQITLVAIDKK